LYITRKTAAEPQRAIAEAFGLEHFGSASVMVSRFAKRIPQDKSLEEKVKQVEKTIWE
jgi:hypothetical protein